MRTYVMLWVILASLLLIALLVTLTGRVAWLILKSLMRDREKSQETLVAMASQQSELTKNLMDRLMSQDLQTYSTMTALQSSSKTFDSEYIDRSDEGEYERLNKAVGAGLILGDTLFTEGDHANAFTTEIGLDDLTKLAENLDG